MNKNKHSWNETLKFSWGHIIALLALFFISYITFMGDFYLNDGNFKMSIVRVSVLFIIMLVTFIGAQIAKAANEKFDRYIIIERVLIILTFVAIALSIVPYNHFWNVHKKRNEIEKNFKWAIVKSRKIFDDYDNYANNRIDNYKLLLEEAVSSQNPEIYSSFGLTHSLEEFQKEAYLQTLILQLKSQNKNKLQNDAYKWIDNTDKNSSVWNVFLIGNIDVISNAIRIWHKMLVDFSSPVLSNEGLNLSTVAIIDHNYQILPFDNDKVAINEVLSELSSLKDTYKLKKGLNIISVMTLSLLYLLLLFPYFLQNRNTKNPYSLIPKKNSESKPVLTDQNNGYLDYDKRKISKKETEENRDIYSGTF